MPVGAGSIKRAAKSADTNQTENRQEAEAKTRDTDEKAAEGTKIPAVEKKVQEQKKKTSGTKSRNVTAQSGKAKPARDKSEEPRQAVGKVSRKNSSAETESAAGKRTYGVGEQLPVHLL